MNDHVLRAALERIHHIADVIRHEPAPDPQRMRGYSLRRALHILAHDARRSSHEFDVSRDLERTHPATRGGLIVPWEAFTRADIVGTNAAGGYLAQTLNLNAADALRPNTVIGGLGATFVDAPMGAAVNLPKQTGVATASWLSTETTALTETDQVFGQVVFTPKTVGSYTELSRLLLLQAGPTPAEFVVRRDLVSVVARALDYAALFGSGVAGQPKGLASFTGVSTFSGTTLNLAGITNAAVALGDALDDSAGIATNRTTAGTLAQRQILGGSERVWMGGLVKGTLCGYPARSSSAITSGAMFLGSWRYLNIVLWGEGIELTANPYGDQASGAGNFQRGVVGIRAFLTCDVAPTFASAFNYASAVT